MKYNDLINELFLLLDENQDIKKIKKLKKSLKEDKNLQTLLTDYKNSLNVKLKKRLFENLDYLEYLKCESNLNILVFDIKKRFSKFQERSCNESN